MIGEQFEVAFGRNWDATAIARFRDDVKRADRMGMRERVFAKAGDSNLATYNSLYGLGCLEPVWGGCEWLRPTMMCYRETRVPAGDDPEAQIRPAEPEMGWNSFSRASAATRTMIIGRHLLEPSSRFASRPLGWLPDSANLSDESMLDCEIRLLKPRLVLLNLGSNGVSYGLSSEQSAEEIAAVVAAVKALGPVPLLFTVPPQLDRGEVQGRWSFAERTSELIRDIALDAGVPLFDQRSLLADQNLVAHGLVEFDTGHFDGIHLETPGGFRAPDSLGKSIDFRPPALRYGANLRNLLLLQTLNALDDALGTAPDDVRAPVR